MERIASQKSVLMERMDLILVNRMEIETVKRERGKEKTELAETIQVLRNRSLYNVGSHICQA